MVVRGDQKVDSVLREVVAVSRSRGDASSLAIARACG